MSQRELVKKPFSILEINSVDERTAQVELALANFSKLSGTYPEYAGMHTRMPGIRLLSVYPNSVYSIFQFWTPMGYAAGLYQFTSSVDYGAWVTPPIEIVLPALPPDLPVDSNGNTLTDIGWTTGSPVSNTGGSNVGIPDDTNGAPTGKGTICQWTNAATTVEVAFPTINGYLYGSKFDDTTTPSGPPPIVPVPLAKPFNLPTSYSSTLGPYGAIPYASQTRTSAAFNLGFGNWAIQQNSDSANTKGTIDFSTLGITDTNPPSRIEFKIRHNPNMPFDYQYIDVPGVSFAVGGNWKNYPLDVSHFLIASYYTINPAPNNGIQDGDFIVIDTVRFSWGGRVCN